MKDGDLIAGAFPDTPWQLVRMANNQAEALAQLIQHYRPPLLAYLVFKKKLAVHDAEDLLQEFSTNKLVRLSIFEKADPARGRLRSYLLASLENYVSSHYRAAAALKRSVERTSSLEDDHTAAVRVSMPADEIQAEWAVQVLSETLIRMRQDCALRRRPDLWSIFEGRELAALFGLPPEPHHELMMQWGFPTEKSVMNAAGTARQKFARMVREVLAETPRSTVGEELLELRKTLQDLGPQWLDRLRMSIWEGVADMSYPAPAARKQPFGQLEATLDATGVEESPREALERALTIDAVCDFWECPPKLLAHVRTQLEAARFSADATLGEVLRHDSPGIALLKAIKDVAKHEGMNSERTVPEEVATLVYYLCIARALTLYGQRITNASDFLLQKGLTWCADQQWAEEWLREIVREGLGRLKASEAGG